MSWMSFLSLNLSYSVKSVVWSSFVLKTSQHNWNDIGLTPNTMLMTVHKLATYYFEVVRDLHLALLRFLYLNFLLYL